MAVHQKVECMGLKVNCPGNIPHPPDLPSAACRQSGVRAGDAALASRIVRIIFRSILNSSCTGSPQPRGENVFSPGRSGRTDPMFVTGNFSMARFFCVVHLQDRLAASQKEICENPFQTLSVTSSEDLNVPGRFAANWRTSFDVSHRPSGCRSGCTGPTFSGWCAAPSVNRDSLFCVEVIGALCVLFCTAECSAPWYPSSWCLPARSTSELLCPVQYLPLLSEVNWKLTA